MEQLTLLEPKEQLKIVQAKYVSQETQTWEDLFSGYDELYAITYSGGLDFISKAVNKFQYAEIIFGYENIVSGELATVIAAQTETVKKICKHKSAKMLAEKIDMGELSLYVSDDVVSHEKIYILRNKEGNTRVITGSANFSYNAFMGLQRENIVVFDDDLEAFSFYKEYYDQYKEQCSHNVAKELLNAAFKDKEYLDNHIEEVPILGEVKTKEIVVVETSQNDNLADVEFVANVKGFESEIKPMLPKPTKDKDTGKLVLDGHFVQALKRKYTEIIEEKKIKQRKLPRLRIDYETRSLYFDNKELDLEVQPEMLATDVKSMIGFLDGYRKFNGKTEEGQKDYYRYLCWYLASPFMPYLRYIASKNGYEAILFPVFGIIYGSSNGGKSQFTKMLVKLMVGKNIPFNGTNDFTSRVIEYLKAGCQGVPINIDDLARNQFSIHSEKIVKDDGWGLADSLINYPSISITTNSIPSIKQDISKRMVVCHIDMAISKENGILNGKRINDSLKSITGTFYKEYFKRMISKVMEIAENMKKGDEDYNPDIFEASSQTVMEIIREIPGCEVPEYMSKLSWKSYFGSKVVGKLAIGKITDAFHSEPQQFKINKKKNELIYTIPETSNYYYLQQIQDELPPDLNCKIASRTLSMNYKEAVNFFGIGFKRNRFFAKYLK